MILKHKEYIDSHTRIIQEFPFAGYLVQEELLRNLVKEIVNAAIFSPEKNKKQELTYLAYYQTGDTCRFASLEDLLSHPNAEPEIIRGLELLKDCDSYQKIRVLFETDGNVTLDIIGPAAVVEGQAHLLRQRLMAFNQHYSWLVKTLVLASRPRRIAKILIFFVFSSLIYSIGMYVYAHIVGINVDPNLIQKGMSYYEQVAATIRSEDINEKLNVLLKGNYRGFVNVSDFLVLCQSRIRFSLVALLMLGAFVWVSNHLKQYYPRSFFAMGKQKDLLRTVEKKRDIWTVGIILACIVNIVCGLIVAFLKG